MFFQVSSFGSFRKREVRKYLRTRSCIYYKVLDNDKIKHPRKPTITSIESGKTKFPSTEKNYGKLQPHPYHNIDLIKEQEVL